MKDLIYLSSPYSDKDPEVVKERFDLIVKAASIFLLDRLFVISPIIHGHPMVVADYELPGDWDFWKEYCETILRKCSKLYIIQMPGWDKSTGVKGEIDYAIKMRIPIYMVTFDDESDYTIKPFDKKAKFEEYAQGYSRHDTPKPGDLIALGLLSNEEGVLVVGCRDFLAYNKVRVPFVKYNEEYYLADSLEVLSEEYVGKLSSARRYVKIDHISDDNFGPVNDYLVYQLS